MSPSAPRTTQGRSPAPRTVVVTMTTSVFVVFAEVTSHTAASEDYLPNAMHDLPKAQDISVMQVANCSVDNRIVYSTTTVSLNRSNSEVAPFMGHMAFLPLFPFWTLRLSTSTIGSGRFDWVVKLHHLLGDPVRPRP